MNLHDRFVQKYGRPPTEVDPDYLEMLNMSKYRIVPMPDKQQAKCSNCGSTKNDGRKYVDFGLDVDWYGIVFLCGNCIYDIAKAMNCFAQFVDRINRLEDRNKTLENLLLAQGDSIESRLSNLMEEVKEYFASLHSISDDGRSDPSTMVDSNSSSGADNTTESDRQATGTEQRTTESTTGPGSKNFSSLAELLNAPTP